MSDTDTGQLLFREAQLHFNLLFDGSNEANIAVIDPTQVTKIGLLSTPCSPRVKSAYVTTYVWFLD